MRITARCLLRAAVTAVCWLVFIAAPARAQLPQLRFSATEPVIFEGNPDATGSTTTIEFIVELSDYSADDVTFLFSTSTFGEGEAISGANCKGAELPTGPDFIGVTNRLVMIPANTLQVRVPVTVCKDTQVEVFNSFIKLGDDDDAFVAQLTNPTNAVCFGSACLTRGHIIDDDGTPLVSVAPISIKEPLIGSKVATYEATVSHPHPGFEVRVNWSTRDGISLFGDPAVARPGACGRGVIGGGGPPDYLSGGGLLIFDPGVRKQQFSVTICSDSIAEETENFSIHLSNPVNAATSDGTEFILDFAPLFNGDFTLEPSAAEVRGGEWLDYRFQWTVTSGVWRDLKSLDLRVRDPESGKIPLWVRWFESGNTFQLCRGDSDDDRGRQDGDHEKMKCGPAVAAGSAVVLDGPHASLDVSQSKASGSGPTGPSVTLDLRVSFKHGGTAGRYDVEVTSETDAGLRDDFAPGAVLTIKR